MNVVSTLVTKKDKYEELLAKYDWSSPYPPRGYQFGVGRGAKAFSTSAELSSGTSAAAVAASPSLLATEKTGLLDLLDRLEENRQKRRREEKKGDRLAVTVAARENKKPKPMISMEDLATIGSGVTNQSLVRRKARTEDMDVVDDYAFADETAVVTVSDLLRSQTFTTSRTLENILGMGSSTEQTTWITHSRAFREMGMVKKAHHALLEGCRLTGSKGPLIWKERLEYTQDPAAQRQLLEEAVQICPGCEELWLLLLEHKPPHEQLHWLQQAVIACPSSENLWLRVLVHIPAPRDKKKIIRKALEVTPRLPSLWAMLARLESYDTGKAIFNAAAAEHLSLQIIVEAAKFEEFHVSLNAKGEKEVERNVPSLCNKRIESFVHQAAQQFLMLDEEKSRREWLETARAAAFERYVITSAYMYLCFVSDKKATNFSLPATWMEDLTALMPDIWHTHDALCAVWAAMLIFYQTQDSPLHDGTNMTKETEVMTAALQLAPLAVLDAALLALKKHISFVNASLMGVGKEEEEEEELDRPGETEAALAVSNGSIVLSTAASQSLPLPLMCVFLQMLLHTPQLCTVDVTLRIAKVLYDRDFHEGASHVLQLGIARHPTSAALFAARAKALVALGHEEQAMQMLSQGTELVSADTDIAWVKLAVYLRSKHADIAPLLEKAIAVFPTSERLWLMRLEAEGTRVKKALNDATSRGIGTAPLITELRQVYSRALSAAHCRFFPTLWCYVAVQLESNLLSNAAVARALLLEGIVVCRQRQHQSKRAEIDAAFGLAKCHIELMHSGRETALEVVRETLQLLPKKDGCFTVPVGELVALSIDLEAPAARGRAAARAVQHWHVRDPLVIVSVAKVYHAAGRYDKALEQSLKAVKMANGRCGDAVALWLKLASLPVYKRFVGERMGITEESELANTKEPISINILLSWLWEQARTEGDNTYRTDVNNSRRTDTVKPNSGPLWVYVSKASDPTNVTLLGYRESIESMLQRVMDLIEL